MARPKKETFEYVPSQNLYRKREKGINGGKAVTAKTPELLMEKLERLREEARIGLEQRENPTLEEYSRLWLGIRSNYVRPQTLNNYKYILNKFIWKSDKSSMLVKELRSTDISEILAPATQMSESIYNNIYTQLKAILDHAVENNIIAKNPMPRFERAGKAPKDKESLTNDQVALLEKTMQGTSCYPVIMLGLYTGMRREEMLALQWDMVRLDVTDPYISVRRTWRTENNRPIIENRTKTAAAVRDIPIPKKLSDYLGSLERTSDFVIHNKSNGPLTETQFRNTWHEIVVRSVFPYKYAKWHDGVKEEIWVYPKKGQKAHNRHYTYEIDFYVHPHMLRRTYITRLILAGMDPKTVQYLAGHESSEITMDIYAKVMYNRPEELGSRIQAAFDTM